MVLQLQCHACHSQQRGCLQRPGEKLQALDAACKALVGTGLVNSQLVELIQEEETKSRWSHHGHIPMDWDTFGAAGAAGCCDHQMLTVREHYQLAHRHC